jgi:Co/Zn/Cd efflux system component
VVLIWRKQLINRLTALNLPSGKISNGVGLFTAFVCVCMFHYLDSSQNESNMQDGYLHVRLNKTFIAKAYEALTTTIIYLIWRLLSTYLRVLVGLLNIAMRSDDRNFSQDFSVLRRRLKELTDSISEVRRICERLP